MVQGRCRLNYFLSGALSALLFTGISMEDINSVNIFEFRLVIQQEMPFNDISYLNSGCSFVIGRGYPEEQFC